MFSEEKAPSTVAKDWSAAKDYRLEEDTSYSTKDSKSVYATQPAINPMELPVPLLLLLNLVTLISV